MSKDSIFDLLKSLGHKVEHLTECHENLIVKIEGLTTQVNLLFNENKALKTLVYNSLQPSTEPAPPPFGELTKEEQSVCWDGTPGKITAIKSYRKRTGCGLKEAKDTIEAWMAAHPKA